VLWLGALLAGIGAFDLVGLVLEVAEQNQGLRDKHLEGEHRLNQVLSENGLQPQNLAVLEELLRKQHHAEEVDRYEVQEHLNANLTFESLKGRLVVL
jgi:hypothetical protein